jgi:nucleoside-diphosphate-sugar epimerase
VTRVLVSGASGFLGLSVLARLAGPDREVHALHARADHPALPDVRWHRLDLADRRAVAALVEQLAPEQLVHLAWCTDHGRFWHAPENLGWVEYSLHLLHAFVSRGGRRLVMVGTCAEYDWSTADAPLVESSSPLAPATLYGVAKDALRRLASAYAEQEGVELAWGRLFLLYGPREAPGRLVSSLVRSSLSGQPVATGSGAHVRDFLHVEDAAGAVVALLDSSVVGAVNIASGVGTAIDEVIDRIVALTGRPELVHRGALPDRPGDPPSLLADVARLRDEVGFTPRWGLADGLAANLRWWQDHFQGELPHRGCAGPGG